MRAGRGLDPRFVPTGPVEIGGELPASTVYLPGISLRDLGCVFPPLVAQSLATIAGSSYGPALTSNSTGTVNTTGAEVVTGNYLGNIGQEITIFWAGDQNAAAPSAGSEIFGIECDANGDAPYHSFALAIDGGANIQAICGIGANYYQFVSSGAWIAQSRASWVGTIQIGGSISLYQRGALLGTTTGLPTGTFATTSTSTLRLGNYNPNGYSNANNAVAGFYNGIWTPTQIAQFNAEPFAMLRPIRRRRFYLASAPASDTGSGADVLAPADGAGAGSVQVSGSGADAAPAPTQAAEAASSDAGAAADTGAPPGAAGAGAASASGAGADAAPLPLGGGAGALEVAGAGAATAPPASASASGQVGSNVGGAGADDAPAPSGVGTGDVSLSGAGAETAPPASASGAGTAGALGTGAGAGGVSGSGAGSTATPGSIAGIGAGTAPIAGVGAGALSSEVPAARIIPLWPSPLRLPDKAASETMDYAIDASALLASPSDTLSVTASCSSLTVAQALVAGSQIVLLLAGGTSGADNAVDVRISAASGRFVHRIVRVLTQ